jgi:hypothetical protein
MTRRGFVTLGAAAISLRAQTVNDRVGAAIDLVCQGLEILSSRSSAPDITRAMGFFSRALDQYPSLGDAHYYRAVCRKKLNARPGMVASDLQAAERYRSEALADRRDPFTLAVPRADDNLTALGDKWALVVGISQFQPDIGAENLSYAEKDATAVSQALVDPGIGRFTAKNVFTLTNEKATTAAIKARMNRIATLAKPEDMVLVYVATHGSSRTEDIKQVSYLYTYDTDVTSRDQIFGTALPMVDVAAIIRTRCRAERTVVVFDTCHSGGGAAGSSTLFPNTLFPNTLSNADFDRLRDGAGRYVISSCDVNEVSYETDGHGCFTASLLRNLRARQGCIPVSDLFAAVQKDVSETVMKRFRKSQRPVMAKSDHSAEIVIGAPSGGASAACA